MSGAAGLRVAVILVNFRGADDTIVAVRGLRDLDWPREQLEIIVVENGSDDGSAERLRLEADCILIESPDNLGFAGGCNLGAAHTDADVVAFLNNDARPDRGWIANAVGRFEDPSVGAVASKVLDWEGKRVDYVGSAMTWFGMGYKPHTGEPIPRLLPEPDWVLFGTGSAMFVRSDVFRELGGFDERYFMFFEDVDLGWRLALRGWRFAYEPTSVAFHRHHASMSGFGRHREQYLLERNALFTLFKNLDQPTLDKVLPAAMALGIRRGIARGGEDSEAFDLRREQDDTVSTHAIAKDALAAPFAIDRFVDELPSLREDRARIQASRVVSDARIWQLFGLADAPVLQDHDYVRGYENIVTTFPVTEPQAPARILIITGDPLGERMAGPAIRAWNIAAVLADAGHEVVLVSLTRADRSDPRFRTEFVRAGDESSMAPLEQWADALLFQGHAMHVFSVIARSEKPMIIDVYDPMHLEQLEQARSHGTEVWERAVADATGLLNDQLRRGDFFVCASERQRQFYLGQLAALGRLSPKTYANDPDFRRLIDVVPFGLPVDAPAATRKAVKGQLPGIGRDDKLLIWAGGLYDWFDPHTLIRAVARLSERRPEVKLLFLGTRHPHPGVPEMPIVASSRVLAEELGVSGRSVFFNEEWVDYDDRHNYLLDADIGVSTHFEHIETTFSFRTRILDYIWAGLPMVVTRGDHFAELVASEGMGRAVPAQDVDALVAAIDELLSDDAVRDTARRAVERIRPEYAWPRVVAPIMSFAAAPWPAADRGSARAIERPIRAARPRGLRHDVGLVVHHLRVSGPRVVLGKVVRRIRR